jgi:hypothetical protein
VVRRRCVFPGKVGLGLNRVTITAGKSTTFVTLTRVSDSGGMAQVTALTLTLAGLAIWFLSSHREPSTHTLAFAALAVAVLTLTVVADGLTPSYRISVYLSKPLSTDSVSAPGQGTTVRLSLPVSSRKKGRALPGWVSAGDATREV